jgi:type VI secretion system secreted protein VgrG
MSPALAHHPLLELITGRDLDAKHPGRPRFDVRSFAITEAISTLFSVRLTALHPSATLDFDEIVGKPAQFLVGIREREGDDLTVASTRVWQGIVQNLEMTRGLRDGQGLSTYEVTLVPTMWLLTQRRNYRMFQFLSEVEIAIKLLDEWKIDHEVRLDVARFKRRKYKVQYAETDYEFFSRILADVGAAFFFERVEGETRLVLVERPERARPIGVLDHEDSPNAVAGRWFATGLSKNKRVRPESVVLRDRDYRRDSRYELQARATSDKNSRLELFYYPENFTFVAPGTDAESPTADDRGRSRTDEREAEHLAQVDLEAQRNDAFTIEFETNDLRVAAGTVVQIENHPSEDINDKAGFLVVEARFGGRPDTELSLSVEAVPTQVAYRSALAPRPRIIGVESATVVGPANEEIHCDEFGRVRVHFHWDRESHRNEASSCWIPVAQTWGGAGYGGIQIPRIGQEVLIDFLSGDPDRPIIIGRVFTALNKTPMNLPADKTQSIVQSHTHKGEGGNKMTMEDANSSQRFDFHAQRDMNLTVLNNRTSKIYGGETRHVDHCRIKTVGQTDSLTAGADILLKAGANYSSEAKVNASISTLTGGITIDSAALLTQKAKLDATYSSGTVIAVTAPKIVLTAGASSIKMSDFGIVISGPNVLINPSDSEAEEFLATGKTPDQIAEEKAAAETKEAQVQQERQNERNDEENAKRRGESYPGQDEFETRDLPNMSKEDQRRYQKEKEMMDPR